MATITIPAENRKLEGLDEINAFLAPFGIWHERWSIGDRVSQDATSEEILAAYAPEVERIKAKGGFITADVINVTSATPNLDALLNKFNKEHTHSEDEVRFIVKGRGIFHIHPDNGPVFAITVEAGDFFNVPAGTKHWFDLCEDRNIRAIRLFQDMSGWTPSYISEGVHANFEPLCFGPRYVTGETIKPVVQI